MMNALQAFHFLRPWWLLLLLPALLLWWLERREAEGTRRWRAAIDPELLRHLIIGGNARRSLAPADLLLAGWMVGIIAVAGPSWRLEASPFAQAARPAMLVLKVTPSMLASDLQPTRLERARQKIGDLLALREGAPTGLVAYAGTAHLVLPPTPDADVIKTMAEALAPDIMPQEGNRLAEAIRLARETLNSGGSIVVFADTAPTDELTALEQERGAPVTLFGMLPAARASSDPTLRAAASALDADLVAPTLDTKDIAGIAHTLATAGAAPPAPGEAPRWQEAGYWLTPLIALLLLGWFRRGWGLA